MIIPWVVVVMVVDDNDVIVNLVDVDPNIDHEEK